MGRPRNSPGASVYDGQFTFNCAMAALIGGKCRARLEASDDGKQLIVTPDASGTVLVPHKGQLEVCAGRVADFMDLDPGARLRFVGMRARSFVLETVSE